MKKKKSPTKSYKINENDWVKIWYMAIPWRPTGRMKPIVRALDVPSAVFTAGLMMLFTRKPCASHAVPVAIFKAA